MIIKLHDNCQSISGSIGAGFGYEIVKRNGVHYGKRCSMGKIPPGGHWEFIHTCASITKYKLHIADIEVSDREVAKALSERLALDILPQQIIAWRNQAFDGGEMDRLDNFNGVFNAKHFLQFNQFLTQRIKSIYYEGGK